MSFFKTTRQYICIVILGLLLCCCSCSSKKPSVAEQQKTALQETAMAYYRRGENIRYSQKNRNIWFPPEEATSQDRYFLDCSGFIHALYYNTFGIELPETTAKMNTYGYFFHDRNPDIIYFDSGEKLKKEMKKPVTFAHRLAELLEIGDILTYYSEVNGHVVLIYDLILNEENEPCDAVIMHSTSILLPEEIKEIEEYGQLKENAETGIQEGSIRLTRLSTIFQNLEGDASFLTILRPLLEKDTYKKVHFSIEEMEPLGFACEWENAQYNETPESVVRRKYAGAFLEAVMNVGDGRSVEHDDLCIYTITIQNNGEKKWKHISFTAEIENGTFEPEGRQKASYQFQDVKPGEIITCELPAVVTGKDGEELIFQCQLDELMFGMIRNPIGDSAAEPESMEKTEV